MNIGFWCDFWLLWRNVEPLTHMKNYEVKCQATCSIMSIYRVFLFLNHIPSKCYRKTYAIVSFIWLDLRRISKLITETNNQKWKVWQIAVVESLSRKFNLVLSEMQFGSYAKKDNAMYWDSTYGNIANKVPKLVFIHITSKWGIFIFFKNLSVILL